MRERLTRFMAGRNGNDQLNIFLLIVDVVLLVLAGILSRGKGSIFYPLAIALLFYIYFRMFSRNISARYQENERFLKRTAGLRRMLRINKKKIEQRKEYSFFKCPVCEQQVRVPKGRGHILITCPRCRHEFEKTT